MRPQPARLLFGLTLCAPFLAFCPFTPPALAAPPLIAQLRSDEPSRLFTVPLPPKSKTPLPPQSAKAEFSLGLWNGGSPKLLALGFRIESPSGQLIAEKRSQALAPHGATTVREGFSLSRLGLYRVLLTARPLRRSEGTWEVQDSLSFAVIAAPLPGRGKRNSINLMVAAPDATAALLEKPTVNEGPSSATADEERGEYQGNFYERLGAAVRPPIALPPKGQAVDKGVVVLPLPSDAPETSAATLRTLVALRQSPALQPFVVGVNSGETADAGLPAERQLVSRAVTALAAGSTEVSAIFSGPSLKTVPDLKRAAAWSALIRLTGGGHFENEIFPTAPLLRAASFEARGQRVAIIWAERNDNPRARLVLPLLGARLLDIWGNEIAREKNGHLVVPLSANPQYVVCDVRQKIWKRAWKAASLEGLRPLAAQVLAFTKPPGTVQGGRPLQVRVRLQNVAITPFQGRLQLAPPPGWSFLNNNLIVNLQPGENRVFSFPVAISKKSANGQYPVSLSAVRGTSKWSWKQIARVATAQKTLEGVKIDGDLREWQGAVWMELKTKVSAEPAKLAIRWDERNLYFAARIREPHLQPRREDGPYEFWNGFDGIQLAFGLADNKNVKPSRLPFRDTDYGFLLSPFSVVDGRPSGRVLHLWGNAVPFEVASVRDRVRWGGAVSGARCAITRDEKRGLTLYEASIPVNEMTGLRPQMRANMDMPVRFSWRLLDDDEVAASWSRANSVFPWWAGSGSFWPSGQALLPAQTPLGFSAKAPGRPKPLFELLPLPLPAGSELNPNSEPAPSIVPLPPTDPAPAPTPTPRPRRPRRSAPKDDDLPEVAPMSPSSLPPAAPEPEGQPLRPSPPGEGDR